MPRFNLPTMKANLSSSHSSQIIHSLHAILKPFLLRRLKADVAADLPPKKEYVLYAPLSVRQSEVYENVLNGELRQFLMGNQKVETKTVEKMDVDKPRKLRNKGKGKKRITYEEESDDEYFERLEKGEEMERLEESQRELEEIGREHQRKSIRKLTQPS
jgi:ATP-dependent DNA helicase